MLNHLSNQEKANHMSHENLGWNDILEEAEYKHKEQVIKGFVRWPPVCHNKDSEAAPARFGANLSQAPVNKNNSFRKNCHRCGKQGHHKFTCPLLTNNGGACGMAIRTLTRISPSPHPHPRPGPIPNSIPLPRMQHLSVLSTRSKSLKSRSRIASLNGVATATDGLSLTIPLHTPTVVKDIVAVVEQIRLHKQILVWFLIPLFG